nr:hypothetical protein CFP56_56104 [Quercus suber]
MDELFTLLWYRSPEDNEEDGVFHLIKDDHDAMAMTKLVRGHGQIHVYVEHPVYEPILINDGNGVLVDIVVGPDHNDPFVLSDFESCSSSELECSCDGYYNGQGYYASSSDNFEDDDSDDGKEPIVEEPQQDGAVTTDSNDSFKDSDVEGAKSMNPNQRNVGKDSASSDSEDLMHMREQIGDGVMNSDYTTEELLSLSESSSDGGFQGDGIYDSESDATINETIVDNVKRKRKTFPVFRPVSNPDDLVFEKHMLFTSAKQFKEAITEYAVKAYLAKLPREMSWQLKTLNMEHTCTMSYKNPRCSANFIAKKLMKKVRRQPDIKLRHIQEVVHKKYVVNINTGKGSRAREKAQEFVDGSYVEQCNQLWDYCAELRRSSPGSTVVMKTHTFNEGELAAEMNLQAGLPYFERLYICCTYKACYEHTIDPLNGANMWILTGLPPVQPPIKRRPPGRPKKKRILEPNEPRRGHNKGLGIAKRCKSCRIIGHNKRSCKGEVGGNSSLPGAQNQRKHRPMQTNGNGQRATQEQPHATSMPSSQQPRTNQQGNRPSKLQPRSSRQPSTNHIASNNPASNNLASSNLTRTNPRKRRRGTVTNETLTASRNASRYKEALRSAGNQTSVHGPRG